MRQTPRECHQRRGAEPEDQQRANHANNKAAGKARVFRRANHQRGKRCRRCQNRRQNAKARSAATGCHDVAKQRRPRNAARAPKRPQRESQRGQQAIKRGHGKRRWIGQDARRHRQNGSQRRRTRPGQRKANRQPKRNSKQCQGHDLEQIGGENQRRRRAQTAQGRNGPRALIKPGGNAGRNSNAAHQQRRQARQRQEKRGAIQEAIDAGCGDIGATDAPAAFGKIAPQIGDQALAIRPHRQSQPIFVSDQTAGENEPRCLQRHQRDHGARAEKGRARHLIRFLRDGGAECEARFTDAQHRTRRHAKPFGNEGVNGDITRAKRDRRLQHQGAIKRIGAINGFQFHQHALAGIGHRHGA